MAATPALLALLLLAQTPPASGDKAPAVQGLIRIPAGKVTVGRDPKDVEKLIQQSPISAQELGGMTPKWETNLPEFLISPTEVTNEMYLRFVQATGYQPPASWFVISRELRLAILEEMHKNDPNAVLDDLKLARWWDEHWKEGKWGDFELKWEMPAHKALEPVVDVSQNDAKAYCRWAGLRLPTELEWVRAARGDDYRTWPFGDKFDTKIVSCRSTDPRSFANKLLPVGMFPGNASPFGCLDMAGNAYEWTGTTYTAFKDFKGWKVKTSAGDVTILPPFDPSLPVAKGGCYAQPDWGTQIDVRVGLFAPARTPYVGFRVASSTQPARNASVIAPDDIGYRVLGAAAAEALDFDNAIGLEKRMYADLSKVEGARQPYPAEDRIPTPKTPAGYAVFDGYQCVALAPLKTLDFAAADKLGKTALEQGPVPVAVLVNSVQLEAPALPPGTYVLGYLPKMSAEEILAMGATLPAKLAEEMKDKKPKTAKPGKDEGKDPGKDAKDKKDSGQDADKLLQSAKEKADLSGVELSPDRPYLVFINMENKAVSSAEMKFEPKLESGKQVDHKLVLDLGGSDVDLYLRVNAQRGKAFGFHIELKPVGDGGSLVKEGYWDGNNYEVKKAEAAAGTSK